MVNNTNNKHNKLGARRVVWLISFLATCRRLFVVVLFFSLIIMSSSQHFHLCETVRELALRS